ALILSKEGRLCVRFFRRADGKLMTRDCPFGIRAVGRRLAWVLGIAAAIFLTIGAALLAAKPQNEGDGNRQSALEWIRNFFAPSPPPVIMEKICVPPGPPANQPAPQPPE